MLILAVLLVFSICLKFVQVLLKPSYTSTSAEKFIKIRKKFFIKHIDELITKAIQDGSLVGSYELSVPYTKTLKDKIIELVDKYKENLGGCVSIIHPIKFNDKTCFWKPTITIQLQSLFNS